MSSLPSEFWKKKSLSEMSEDEWEALCDGCGICCFRKFFDERKRLYYTCIACDGLDLDTGKCAVYQQRFALIKDCTKLKPQDVKKFHWLPKTCAYRLVYEGKPLFDWHPLISGDPNSVRKAGIFISNAIHEKDVEDMWDYVIEEL